MCRCVRLAFLGLASLVIVPVAAHAQASITGVIRDTSGAVLPGVTVEAASPALIEKVRSAVSGGTGQYRIEDLRPGAYTVTFTLPGFSTVKREGIQLTGNFTASINIEMRVGALEETITVTGETPIVDVQNTTRQRVLDAEILEALPSTRSIPFVAALTPGVSTANADVGGIRGMGPSGAGPGAIFVRGVDDPRLVINGNSVHSVGTGSGNQGAANMAAYVEILVDTGSIGAEQKEGGVRMQLIPKDGGNTFSGYFLGAWANDSFASSNYNDDLRNRGLRTPNSLKRIWDVNAAFGGPLKRDKLWFHVSPRYTGAQSYRALFRNRNAGNPNAWSYDPDPNRREEISNVWLNGNVRITWQATPRNKFGISFDQARSEEHPRDPGVNNLTEAGLNQWAQLDPKRIPNYDWNSAVTNRLLLEASLLHHMLRASRVDRNVMFTNPEFPPGGPVKLNAVLEQSTGLNYRATPQAQNTWNESIFWRAAMSYVTGAHAFKVGFNYGKGTDDQTLYAVDSPMSFRFNNGVPNRLTLRALPTRTITKLLADHGLYVQDKWTVDRITLTVGLRYDYYHVGYPETPIGPGEFAPTRSLVFPKTDGVRWHELEPRSGLAYDIFGTGKTAFKISLNRYLAGLATDGAFGRARAPASRLVNTTNRSWRDANRNFVPDCELLSPAANGECGAMDNPDFGSLRTGVSYDPNTLKGWGKRDHNWQFATSVQHELAPRISMEAGYYRTWFGNFIVTDDRAVGPADFDTFSITAPSDPRLPGGGYTVSGLYDLKPTAFGRAADDFITFADKYGKQIDHVNGFDLTFNVRPRNGLLFQGGTNWERRTTDNCEVMAKLPEILEGAPVLIAENTAWMPASYCHQQSPFRTQLKFLATYTVPRVDVQLSASFQSMPGLQIWANYTVTNAIAAPSLGRNFSGDTSNIVVNIVEPGTMYGERMNQLDLRFGKILRTGGTRVNVSLDLYNALNANPVVRLNQAFATWQRPQEILNHRFAKLVLQFGF